MSIVSVFMFVFNGIVFPVLVALYFYPECPLCLYFVFIRIITLCLYCSLLSESSFVSGLFFLSPLTKRAIPWRQPSNVYCIWSSRIGSVCWSEIHETNEMPKGVKMCLFVFVYMTPFIFNQLCDFFVFLIQFSLSNIPTYVNGYCRFQDIRWSKLDQHPQL